MLVPDKKFCHRVLMLCLWSSQQSKPAASVNLKINSQSLWQWKIWEHPADDSWIFQLRFVIQYDNAWELDSWVHACIAGIPIEVHQSFLWHLPYYLNPLENLPVRYIAHWSILNSRAPKKYSISNWIKNNHFL